MFRFLARIAAPMLFAGALLAGCAGQTPSATDPVGQALTNIQTAVNNVNTAVTTYAPIVGKTLLEFDNILYQVECSPATPEAGAVAASVLNIVAPNTTAASKLATRVQQNDEIAAQICPLVQAIVTTVGSVPAGTPAVTVPATPAATSGGS